MKYVIHKGVANKTIPPEVGNNEIIACRRYQYFLHTTQGHRLHNLWLYQLTQDWWKATAWYLIAKLLKHKEFKLFIRAHESKSIHNECNICYWPFLGETLNLREILDFKNIFWIEQKMYHGQLVASNGIKGSNAWSINCVFEALKNLLSSSSSSSRRSKFLLPPSVGQELQNILHD